MDRFMDALEQGNLETLRKYPKADLHNHFALGGSRRFLYQATGKKIEPLVHPLASMAEMDQWSQKYIGQYFNSTEGRKLLIRATFQQAKEDGVTVLEIGVLMERRRQSVLLVLYTDVYGWPNVWNSRRILPQGNKRFLPPGRQLPQWPGLWRGYQW